MRAMGKMTTAMMLAALGVAVSFGWRSRSDLQRYLKMRNM